MILRTLWTDQYTERPEGVEPDTLVIHSMYHPQEDDCFNPEKCKAWLDTCEVSSHYIIDRQGEVWQTVPEHKMAWHAGESKMPFPDDQRTRVNDFSLGVELIASEDSLITGAQYSSLGELVIDISRRHALTAIVSHSQIAPLRKTDPWGFDWALFRQACLDASFNEGKNIIDAVKMLDLVHAAPNEN